MFTKALRMVGRSYASVAIISFTTGLLLILVNFSAFWYLSHRSTASGVDKGYLPFDLPAWVREEIYPGMSREEVSYMLKENWAISYEYAPYREFQVKAGHGRYTNNSEAGFRYCKDQGPWPPSPENYNVFLFGGSTAYNLGVPENDTIASHLQECLGEVHGKHVCLYNFGCPLFFSSPESVLFERLLVQGYRPDAAVFIDGLNEYFHEEDNPGFTSQIKVLFENSQSLSFHLKAAFDNLPMVVYLRRHYRIGPEPAQDIPYDEAAIKALAEKARQRYWENQKMIMAAASAAGVKSFFIWQPIPLYKYKGSHPFALMGYGRHGHSGIGYPLMAEYVSSHPSPANFLWLADMQEKMEGMLYVDIVHYNGRMSREIAGRITDFMRSQL